MTDTSVADGDIAVDGTVLRKGKLGSAVFSQDGLYRYRLTRQWGDAGLFVGWAMKNPSRAGHERNDMTVTKCIGYSKRLGGCRMAVVNLGAYIATDPAGLLRAADPIGRHNFGYLRALALSANVLVVAWGALTAHEREILGPSIRALRGAGVGIICLGRTKTGSPRHPSRLAYEVDFEPWGNAEA